MSASTRAPRRRPGRPLGKINPAPQNPERVASVLRMRSEGWKYEAIAVELGISPQAVGYLIQRWGGKAQDAA